MQWARRMDDREKALFPLDLTDFDWDEYNYYFAHGLMRYVLKSDLNPIPPDARPHVQRQRHAVEA